MSRRNEIALQDDTVRRVIENCLESADRRTPGTFANDILIATANLGTAP